MRSYIQLGLALFSLPSLFAAPFDDRSRMADGYGERSIEERNIEARQYGVQIVNNCYKRGEVALTFDDGFKDKEIAHANLFSQIGASTTFFVTGNMHACIYDRAAELRELYARGFVIGWHSWDHPDLTKLTEAQVEEQFEKVERAFVKILGIKPLYFRPPYGYYNDIVLRVAGRRGYTKLFLWTGSAWDWTDSLQQQSKRFDDWSVNYPAPQLILQHSNEPYTLEATKYALKTLGAKGYKFVNANTCTGGGPAYKIVGLPGIRDSTWVC